MGVTVAMASCLLALIPAVMFARNLGAYRRLPAVDGRDRKACSVLIPARNEEGNIAAAVRSVLESGGTNLEVIVLDDGSTDRTAEIVHEIARSDRRVRIESAPPLPEGWCGKQHACYVLSGLAVHPVLIFLDADVRLRSGAVARMAVFLEQSGVALASGVPEQVTRSFSERLLVPFIHFVLLGFLPIRRMRRDGRPALGAGCGQLFVARREAYEACGGHSAIRATLHDGPKLPRVFRAAGFRTDLFDATDVAVCRMFPNGADVWRGLTRNAHEGLGSSRLIVPATVLLFGGQVLPLIALIVAGLTASPWAFAFSLAGTGAAFLPRLLAVVRFRQPLDSSLLHPMGICALLGIQWVAFLRSLRRRPAVWKGRAYLQAPGT